MCIRDSHSAPLVTKTTTKKYCVGIAPGVGIATVYPIDTSRSEGEMYQCNGNALLNVIRKYVMFQCVRLDKNVLICCLTETKLMIWQNITYDK